MSSQQIPPSLVLGLGNLSSSDPTKIASFRGIIDVARELGIKYIDTARIYDAAESFIGNEGLASEFEIDTKAPMDHAPGGATTAGVLEQWEKSSMALKTAKVRCYLLHHPAEDTPLSEALEGIQILHQARHFEHWGLSNFSPSEVQEAHTYMFAHAYVLPTIYQVSYGLASRRNATTLFPVLRGLNIAIQVYGCLGSGLLSRTPEQIRNGEGHFDPSTILGKILQDIYGKPSYLDFLVKYNTLAKEAGMSRASLAYRWVCWHGGLDFQRGDQVLVGASSKEQLKETVKSIGQGRLEEWVVGRLDGMWKGVESEAPENNFATYLKLKKAGVLRV